MEISRADFGLLVHVFLRVTSGQAVESSLSLQLLIGCEQHLIWSNQWFLGVVGTDWNANVLRTAGVSLLKLFAQFLIVFLENVEVLTRSVNLCEVLLNNGLHHLQLLLDRFLRLLIIWE